MFGIHENYDGVTKLSIAALCKELLEEYINKNPNDTNPPGEEYFREKIKSNDRSGLINKLNDNLGFDIEMMMEQSDQDKFDGLKLLKLLYYIEKDGLPKKDIIKNNVTSMTLIGGEPTIHPQFVEILRKLEKQEVHLFTNAIRFSEKKFCEDVCKQKNLKDITISIKGFNEKSFKEFSDEISFVEFCSAIENLNEKGTFIRVNYNCTENLSQSMVSDFVYFLRYYGLHEIVLHDIRPYITESGELIKKHSMEPLQLIAQELEKAGIVPYIRLNQPFCRYNPTFLKQFLDSKRVMATCAVKKQQGIFVDPDLNIILCNELRHIIMGGYQRDFWDYKSMLDVYNKQDTVRLYNKLEGCPMKKCVKCDMWEKCGGSCILHWL